MQRRTFFLLFMVLTCHVRAINLEPWYPRIFEINPYATLLTQLSSAVQSPHGDFDRGLHANFFNSGAYAAYYDWGGELDVSFAESSERCFGFDSCGCTVRYLIWDDVALVDPLSVVASLSLRAVGKTALNDLSTFHHGRNEAVAHISAGKEVPFKQFWFSRFWGTVGFGIADAGSPWWHFHLSGERNACDKQRWRLFVDSLIGCGGRSLRCGKPFHGYGSISHRSVDVGADYRYTFESDLQATLSYCYRVYSRNFPKNTNSISLSFLYPFGL